MQNGSYLHLVFAVKDCKQRQISIKKAGEEGRAAAGVVNMPVLLCCLACTRTNTHQHILADATSRYISLHLAVRLAQCKPRWCSMWTVLLSLGPTTRKYGELKHRELEGNGDSLIHTRPRKLTRDSSSRTYLVIHGKH